MSQPHSLQGLIAFAGLVWILSVPWQRAWADYARQILFEARDELFALAGSGAISVTDETYVALRDWMNAMIRFAPAISFFRSVAHGLVTSGATSFSNPQGIANQARPSVRPQLAALIHRCEAALAIMIVARSPLLWIPLLLAVPIGLVILPVTGARRALDYAIAVFAKAVEADADGRTWFSAKSSLDAASLTQG